MDYFRLLGSSKETAKELKVFGLANYFIEGYKGLSNRAYQEHRLLSSKRLWVGSLLAVLRRVCLGGLSGSAGRSDCR